MPVIYPAQIRRNESLLSYVKTGSSIKHRPAFSTIYQGSGAWRDIGNTNISLGGAYYRKPVFNANEKEKEKERKKTQTVVNEIINNTNKKPRTKTDIQNGAGFRDA